MRSSVVINITLLAKDRFTNEDLNVRGRTPPSENSAERILHTMSTKWEMGFHTIQSEDAYIRCV